MKRSVLGIIAVLAVAVVVVAAVALSGILGGGDNNPPGTGMTIVETAEEDGNFTNLVTALQATGLNATLNGTGPFTVFAPNDAAFEAMNQTQLQELLADEENLSKVLQYHVISGEVMASDIETNTTMETVEGSELLFIVNETGTYVNNAKVIKTDINASNGVIHVIDSVLMPPSSIVATAMNNTDLSSLVSSLQQANLTEALNGTGPFTVFAPTNEAFEAFQAGDANLSEVLQYHVLPYRLVSSDFGNKTLTTLEGSRLIMVETENGTFVNGARVTMKDVVATNGVIHVIDKVLVPPPTIAEFIMENATFSTLRTAVETANLTEALNGTGPFTLFAPTNEAFAALDPAVLDALLADPENLSKVLQYHVAPGVYAAANVTEQMTLTTLDGRTLNVTVNETGVFINDAMVTVTDIYLENGVIHVIDAVLVPPSEEQS